MQSANYQFEPFSLEILKVASEITDIPELHERLIVATARHLDIPIITNDPDILKSNFDGLAKSRKIHIATTQNQQVRSRTALA